MNGQQVLPTGLGTSSKEVGVLFWWGSVPALPCTRNENYGLRVLYQLDSVSWQTQRTTADVQLEQKFNELARKWKRETINVSSIQQMVLHPCYQEIIAMGPRAVPLILNQLKQEPDFWFWALRALAREDPVTEDIQGDLTAMTKAWLDWGSKHAYF